MSVTFNGTTIVSNSQGNNFFGEDRVEYGDLDDEVYTRSKPRAAGVSEVSAGTREAYHTIYVRYETPAETTVRATLKAFRVAGTYGSLVVETSSGGTDTLKYCRLASIRYSVRQSGVLNANKVQTFTAVLVFKQVRPTAP
jgi:hypothetical protein